MPVFPLHNINGSSIRQFAVVYKLALWVQICINLSFQHLFSAQKLVNREFDSKKFTGIISKGNTHMGIKFSEQYLDGDGSLG